MTVGKFCMFGPGVTIHLCSNHHPDWISAYDFSWIIGDRRRELLTNKGNVEIKNDVWIGQNVIILPGVTIEDGCIVAAGSIVTKSLPPYSIAAGVPARIIRRRFSENNTELLLKMRWWDWDESDIAACIPLLESDNIDDLFLYYKSKILGENKND